jgi:hypothetical protein
MHDPFDSTDRDPPQRGSMVVCSACGATVDMSKPLPSKGWQSVHRCAGRHIEAEALRAGDRAWAWRTSAT